MLLPNDKFCINRRVTETPEETIHRTVELALIGGSVIWAQFNKHKKTWCWHVNFVSFARWRGSCLDGEQNRLILLSVLCTAFCPFFGGGWCPRILLDLLYENSHLHVVPSATVTNCGYRSIQTDGARIMIWAKSTASHENGCCKWKWRQEQLYKSGANLYFMRQLYIRPLSGSI